MRIIKRYRNRRLYDTSNSRTITQTELAGLIRDGVQVKVIETVTGSDITLSVLGRIMLSESSSWKDIKKSKELMRQLISTGGEQSMSLFKNTILASIGHGRLSHWAADQWEIPFHREPRDA